MAKKKASVQAGNKPDVFSHGRKLVTYCQVNCSWRDKRFRNRVRSASGQKDLRFVGFDLCTERADGLIRLTFIPLSRGKEWGESPSQRVQEVVLKFPEELRVVPLPQAATLEAPPIEAPTVEASPAVALVAAAA